MDGMVYIHSLKKRSGIVKTKDLFCCLFIRFGFESVGSVSNIGLSGMRAYGSVVLALKLPVPKRQAMGEADAYKALG